MNYIGMALYMIGIILFNLVRMLPSVSLGERVGPSGYNEKNSTGFMSPPPVLYNQLLERRELQEENSRCHLCE